MNLRLVLVAPAAAVLLGGCESNYERNARVAAQGHELLAAAHPLTIARASPDVKVRRAVVVRGGGTFAAAVELRSRSRRPQGDVPLLIDVRQGGRSVYRNDLAGLQPALQRVALVPAGGRVWWVDDQLLGVTAATSVRAKVGAGKPVGSARPKVRLRSVHFVTDANGTYLTGRVVNRGSDQLDLPIFGVALRGGKVVAAGRAIVHKSTAARDVRFRLIFVGNPRGARIDLTIAPTVSP